MLWFYCPDKILCNQRMNKERKHPNKDHLLQFNVCNTEWYDGVGISQSGMTDKSELYLNMLLLHVS